MGLFLTSITDWTTKRPERYKNILFNNYILLNTNRLCDIRETTDGHTEFLYHQAPDDRRCSPDHITCGTTLTILKVWHNYPTASKFGTFSVFPAFDITATPVETKIEWDDIAMIYQTPKDLLHQVCHMVYYQNGFKRKSVMIDENSLLHVLAEEYI
jgi:hypothetical protein